MFELKDAFERLLSDDVLDTANKTLEAAYKDGKFDTAAINQGGVVLQGYVRNNQRAFTDFRVGNSGRDKNEAWERQRSHVRKLARKRHCRQARS